ncbi:MAG: PIN domain-containing protein [Deltaproteobacteria bacterium]|nr:PIN domain-containing protein [Deltaproteobacteria bacterium]
MRTVVLDAWAVLALLRGERPAVEAMGHYLNQATAGRARLLLNVVNFGEVLYRLIQVEGAAAAHRHAERFRAGAVEIAPARESLVIAAAELKAAHAISYADAFAVATARLERGILATGDPEILALPASVVRTRRLARG